MAVNAGGAPQITLEGYKTEEDCQVAVFRLEGAGPSSERVEVCTTRQIEHLLAHQLGKEALEPREVEAVLAVGGRWLIQRELREGSPLGGRLLLDSEIFRLRGEERRLLREAGLLRGRPEHPQP
ncbi:MAG TPA: hypothetical protein VIO14_14445 [Dehalococcoidia bacterium]